MRQLFCRKVTNFGGNVSFTPKNCYSPKTDKEVLEILDRHADGHIRASGSLHSWSSAVVSKDVLIDLHAIDRVRVSTGTKGEVFAEVGAGCTLDRLLDVLSKSKVTLPTLGAVKLQTISGAISTATHGSGRSSLSHYIEEMRVAAYDKTTGKAKIYTWKNGDPELIAARCAVGCTGVILSVKFRCVPDYCVEENVRVYDTIKEVLAREQSFPLQQAVLLPYSWKYFSFERRVTDEEQGFLKRTFWKVYDFVTFQFLAHFMLKATLFLSSVLDNKSLIPLYYTKIVPPVLRTSHTFVNKSEDALTLHTSHHDMFKHLEMELFIPERNIERADSIIRAITSAFADSKSALPEDLVQSLREIDMYDDVMAHRGSYQHHYPFFFRSVLPDEALISMSSGGKYYSVSFFTYLAPDARKEFYEYAECIARCITQLCDARLHWGKYFPLSHAEIQRLYPSLDEFRQICKLVDPRATFQNDFTRVILGFGN